MRIIYASLSVAAGLLLIGWAGPAPVGSQNCCHGSADKAAHSGRNRVVEVPAVSPVTTDGVRREFNASNCWRSSCGGTNASARY